MSSTALVLLRLCHGTRAVILPSAYAWDLKKPAKAKYGTFVLIMIMSNMVTRTMASIIKTNGAGAFVHGCGTFDGQCKMGLSRFGIWI